MNIRDLYIATVQPSPFTISQYRTPQQYLDPAKIIEQKRNMKYKNKPSQGKFKPSKRNKQFFIDELIQPLKQNPSPDKYKTTLDLLKQSNKGNKITNAIKQNAKKYTYIDQIQIKQNKQKAPGVGKYNLLTLTDFQTSSSKKLKNKDNPERQSYFETLKVLSIKVPGPGEHNPHSITKKIKQDRTDYKFYQQKHKKEQGELKRSLSAKLGPTTYNPINFNTFDSIKQSSKHKQISKWTHGTIQIRKGLKSAQKHPSPAQYDMINKWNSSSMIGYWGKKQKGQSGKVDMFAKTVKSARSLNIYRD